MCQFIETLSLNDGVLDNILYHQARLDRTIDHFYPGSTIDLSELLGSEDLPTEGWFRLTVTYSNKVDNIECIPYHIREIERFEFVEVEALDYGFKYKDRTSLQTIASSLKSNEEAIIIVDKKVTDTTYTNLVFLQNGEWWTPKQCLLKGTQRQYLLDQGLIREADILMDSLFDYSHFRVINAMMGWSNAPIYSINQIQKA
ncbi:aminotransferase class IV [Prolixibacteraceae bacterium]|nr:aminotransferase class IV [Prolixibacteraceae bacterium]